MNTLIIPSAREAQPVQHQPEEVPELIACNLRHECNNTFYYMFVGNVCVTAASGKVSAARKQTRQIQQLAEESEDAQARVLGREYLEIVDGLVTELVSKPEVLEKIGTLLYVFQDVATRSNGEALAKTIAAALLAFNFGRVFYDDVSGIVRNVAREKKIQTILKDLVVELSGKPFTYWDTPLVHSATQGVVDFIGELKN